MIRKLLIVALVASAAIASASSVKDRVKQFEEEHITKGISPANALKSLVDWENADYSKIAKRLEKNELAASHAKSLHDAFLASDKSYLSSGIAYIGYSLILSVNCLYEEKDLPEDHNKSTTQIIKNVIKAITSRKKYDFSIQHGAETYANFEEYSSLSRRTRGSFKRLYRAYDHGITPLFFSSVKGYAQFRSLNRSAAIKAPLNGVPLARSSFDGEENALPLEFTYHDLGHIFFNEGGFSMFPQDAKVRQSLQNIYGTYKAMDDMLLKYYSQHKVKPSTKRLDDKAEFFIGHENGMAIAKTKNTDEPHTIKQYPQLPLDKHKFINICDYAKARAAEVIGSVQNGISIETEWNYLKENYGLTDADKEMYYKDKTLLHKFESKVKKGFVISNIDYIKQNNLPKDGPISEDEVVDVYEFTFPFDSEDNFQHAANMELVHVFENYLNLDIYNEIFSWKQAFNGTGIKFEVWNGEEFNADGMNKAIAELIDGFRNRYSDCFSS